MLAIFIDDDEVQKALKHLAKNSNDLQPVMKRIGERLQRSADDNFRAESNPEGEPWVKIAPATLKAKKRRKKDGLKILSDGGNLRGNINYRVGLDSVTIGSPEPYAAIHQLGGKAGRNKSVCIPARPFLGVGPADKQEILQLISDHLRIK